MSLKILLPRGHVDIRRWRKAGIMQQPKSSAGPGDLREFAGKLMAVQGL